MSPLTKTIIVLLTLASIFLCGIVVAYVGHADNYREAYKTIGAEKDAAKAAKDSALKELSEKKKDFETQKDQLTNEVGSLKTAVAELQTKLKNLEIEKATLVQKVATASSEVTAASQTAEQQRQLFEETFAELKSLKAIQINEREQIKDLTDQLIVKMAVIDNLQKEKRQLEQERSQLRSQVSQVQLRTGREPAPSAAMTPERTIAPPVMPPPVREIGLNGIITAIDLRHSLAEISIGTAHGVKKNMRFFVTRDDRFICELLIFDVDAEKAVGILERVQFEPRVGDLAATNL